MTDTLDKLLGILSNPLWDTVYKQKNHFDLGLLVSLRRGIVAFQKRIHEKDWKGRPEIVNLREFFHRSDNFHGKIVKNVTINSPFNSSEKILVFIDPDYFHIALQNLIENAKRAGATAVDIDISQKEGKGIIDVIDNGGGIEEENAPHIFYRGISFKEGKGLGLDTVKSIAEKAGGEVGVLDTLTQEGIRKMTSQNRRSRKLNFFRTKTTGTTFRIVLPTAPQTKEDRPSYILRVPIALSVSA